MDVALQEVMPMPDCPLIILDYTPTREITLKTFFFLHSTDFRQEIRNISIRMNPKTRLAHLDYVGLCWTTQSTW